MNSIVYSEFQKMNIDSMICGIVQMFKTKENRDKTFAIELVFEATKYEPEEVNFRKRIVILAASPSNYTKVCWVECTDAESPDLFKFKYDTKNKIEINFEGDHDSCWRDAVSRIIKKVASESANNFDENDTNIHCYTHFGMIDMALVDGVIESRDGYDTGKATFIPNALLNSK